VLHYTIEPSRSLFLFTFRNTYDKGKSHKRTLKTPENPLKERRRKTKQKKKKSVPTTPLKKTYGAGISNPVFDEMDSFFSVIGYLPSTLLDAAGYFATTFDILHHRKEKSE